MDKMSKDEINGIPIPKSWQTVIGKGEKRTLEE